MRIRLHGEPLETDATTVGQLVDARVPDRRGVAVALDGNVLPRASWDTTALHNDVEVEIVGAVQGG